MTVREVISQAVSVAVAGEAKARGFRKKALTFRRKHGQTDQVLHFQLSRGNTAEAGAFYVNVGLCFDAVTDLGASTDGSIVIAGEPVQFSARLEELVPGVPEAWDVTARTNARSLGEKLGAALAPVFERLEAVDAPTGMLREFPLDDGFQRVLRAQLEYVNGRLPAALAELKLVAAEFADRKGMSLDRLIERYGMVALRPLLKGA